MQVVDALVLVVGKALDGFNTIYEHRLGNVYVASVTALSMALIFLVSPMVSANSELEENDIAVFWICGVTVAVRCEKIASPIF